MRYGSTPPTVVGSQVKISGVRSFSSFSAREAALLSRSCSGALRFRELLLGVGAEDIGAGPASG